MKSYPKIFLFSFVATLILTSFKSDKRSDGKEEIHWMTIEQAYAKMQKEPRKILIDVYTDWCGWCKVMDRETFKNKDVAAYVNRKFYAVKLNAEQTEPITLGDKKFESAGKTHSIALALTNNQPSYPTTVFLEDNFQMIQPIPGYMKAKEFYQIITFIGEGYHKKEAFDNYKSKTYKELFPGR